MKWRLLRDGKAAATLNMGIDEAILDAVAARASPPTLRLYSWKPSAVSVGRFQALVDSVNLLACKEEGIDVVRRISGGGSVFHGESGELTYSIALNEDHLPTHDIASSFGYLLGGVLEALRSLGLKAELAPINDVLVNGRKVSGSAQVRRSGAVLQHGTLLLDIDKELAFRVLKVPFLKTQLRSLQSPADRVTSIAAEGVSISASRFRRLLERGFAKALDTRFSVGGLSDVEARTSGMYAEKRYSDPSWTGSR